jgi:hypothetical protein
MALKYGLKGSNQISNPVKNKTTGNNNESAPIYGKVFGVVTGINLPTIKMYEKANKRIGAVFYKDYYSNRTEDGSLTDAFLNTCNIAYPFYSNIQDYPLLNEIILILQGASIGSQTKTDTKGNIPYWLCTVNLWGNNEQNAQSSNSNSSLGKTYIENGNIKNLISYEGDYILSGRTGQSIRFGSTVGLYSNPANPNYNEWSKIGKNGSPILILSNGLNFNSKPQELYSEQINKDASSIYLTSTQALPIELDSTGLKSPLIGEPVSPQSYNNSQVVLNGDRILINSKKDEIMLFAKTNNILKSNTINLIGNSIELISNDVYIGKNSNGDLPSEPVLLGNKTLRMFSDLISSISDFTNEISSVTDSNGVPIAAIKSAADNLNSKLEQLLNTHLDPDNSKTFIASNQVFIS